MTFEIGTRVRCVCPSHVRDTFGFNGKIARVVEGLEKRLVMKTRFALCYVVEIDGEKYNALPEWLTSATRLTAHATRHENNLDDGFFGVSGKL